MIQEAYVSFETAKLLKEKGFDSDVRQYYYFDDEDKQEHLCHDDREDNPNDFGEDYYSAPTHQMAMRWLRDKGVYIHVEPYIAINTESYELKGYKPWITTLKINSRTKIGSELYVNFYEEAVEKALKYSLEELL